LAYLILVGILQSRRLKLSDQLLNKPDQFLPVFFVLDQASQFVSVASFAMRKSVSQIEPYNLSYLAD